MAKKPPKNPPGGDGKKPKPKMSPALIKAGLRQAIREEMDTIRRQAALNALYLNKSLGVGEIKSFEKEWEKFFPNSSPLKVVSTAEKVMREKTNPELKKVSVEVSAAKPKKNK